MPFSLALGMGSSLIGLILLSVAWTYGLLLLAAGLVGLGSAVFLPKSSRVARPASGGRYGLAKTVFQVGGNAGTALRPLLEALVVVPRGQSSVACFAIAALAGIGLLTAVGACIAAAFASRPLLHGARAGGPAAPSRAGRPRCS